MVAPAAQSGRTVACQPDFANIKPVSGDEKLRDFPAVHEVAERIAAPGIPRPVVVAEIRRVLDDARREIRAGGGNGLSIESRVERALSALAAPSLRRVINATGVVLHTNLGRAPLGPQTIHAGYSNLEYDFATGRRGKRDVHAGALIERLLGAPGIAVNNNAAAIYLALERTGRGPRSRRLARRTDRNRRRLSHPRHHAALGRPAARSGHHQPHRHRRLSRRPSPSARACCCACIPAISASTDLPRAPVACRTGRAGPRARHSRFTKTWAAAAWWTCAPSASMSRWSPDSLRGRRRPGFVQRR